MFLFKLCGIKKNFGLLVILRCTAIIALIWDKHVFYWMILAYMKDNGREFTNMPASKSVQKHLELSQYVSRYLKLPYALKFSTYEC